MELTTTRFGVIEMDMESIITFTQPIIGFQEFRRFILFPGPENSQLWWLQSADAGDLAFMLIDPVSLDPDYAVSLSPHDLTELAATDVEDLAVFTLLVVPQDTTKIRTNLRAPILINPKHRLAKQIVLDNNDYPIQFYLAQTGKAPVKSQ